MFTSALSVNELALGTVLDLRPLRQVMGSSFHQVGWTGYAGGGWGLGGALFELRPISDAWNDARRLALGRLSQEAKDAGADAVIGVHVREGRHDWAAGAIEFTAIGTAVREPGAGRREVDDPVLTGLSAQEYVQLVRAGFRPAGLVAATSVFYVQASWRTQRLTSGWPSGMVNAELEDFTQGIYAAREHALGRLGAQADRLRADGVVGVRVDEHQHVREIDAGGGSRKDLVVTFHVLGTAITGAGTPGSGFAPEAVVRRNDRRPGT